MKKCLKKFLNILLLIPLLFTLCIPIHANAISTDDLDKSGDIGYIRMKLFVKESPKEVLVHVLKNDSGEVLDLYTYPQYDYIIDATLPVGDYTVQDVSCKEGIAFDEGQTFTIEKNGIATVKVPQSGEVFEDFDEPLSSDGIGEDISLLDGTSDAVYSEEIGDDVIQPRNNETDEIALYTEETSEKTSDSIAPIGNKTMHAFIVAGTSLLLVGIIGAYLVIKKEKEEEKRKKKNMEE